MYQKFLEEVGNFVFMENQPEPADIIFVPETVYFIWQKKRQSFIDWGWHRWFFQVEEYSISSGKFSRVTGEAEKYNGAYQTEWEFLKDVLMKNGVPGECRFKGRRGKLLHGRMHFFREK